MPGIGEGGDEDADDGSGDAGKSFGGAASDHRVGAAQRPFQGRVQTERQTGEVVFISARPGMMKEMSHKMLRAMGAGDVVLLTGRVSSLWSHDAMAARKFTNFCQYARLFPEYRYVWVGDSGQGDIEFARMMLRASRDGAVAVPIHAFIHDVTSGGTNQGLTPPEERAALAAEGIYVFDSYVQAYAIAVSLGIAEPAVAMTRVLAQAEYEMRCVKFTSEAMRDARAAEFEAGRAQLMEAVARARVEAEAMAATHMPSVVGGVVDEVRASVTAQLNAQAVAAARTAESVAQGTGRSAAPDMVKAATAVAGVPMGASAAHEASSASLVSAASGRSLVPRTISSDADAVGRDAAAAAAGDAGAGAATVDTAAATAAASAMIAARALAGRGEVVGNPTTPNSAALHEAVENLF